MFQISQKIWCNKGRGVERLSGFVKGYGWGGVPDLSKGYGVIRGQCGNKETALTVFVGILRGIVFMEGTAGKAAAAVASVSRVMITFIVSRCVCAIIVHKQRSEKIFLPAICFSKIRLERYVKESRAI